MRAELRGLDFEPDPRALPADPAAFTFQARLYIGAAADRGEESFDVTVSREVRRRKSGRWPGAGAGPPGRKELSCVC